jgi:hypothetical protein
MKKLGYTLAEEGANAYAVALIYKGRLKVQIKISS